MDETGVFKEFWMLIVGIFSLQWFQKKMDDREDSNE
jgi:hypothetical protein